ncbi:hypothetical protein PAMP_002203 [Pampus punctatissimus]
MAAVRLSSVDRQEPTFHRHQSSGEVTFRKDLYQIFFSPSCSHPSLGMLEIQTTPGGFICQDECLLELPKLFQTSHKNKNRKGERTGC